MPSRQGFDGRLLSYAGLLVLLGGTFLADLTFPLGTAVWVIYLLPTVLTYLTMHRILPVIVAATATVLMAIGFAFAPEGIDTGVALVNRGLASFINLLLAAIGFLFIGYRTQNRRQQWLRDGEAGLASVLAGELTPGETAAAALRFLVDRLGAGVGAIYLRNGDRFRRQATFGVPATAPVPDELHAGDGLLAEAVRDCRSHIVTPVPAGYLTFGTALGQASPRSLLVGVSAVDGMVNGVVELGVFDRHDHQTDALPFLDMVSDQLAIAFRSALYRARLQDLLAETQAQATELQAQGEELRATNEELDAQSRQLMASQAQLEDQQAELERSNAQLEEQTQSLEAQRDELTRAQASLQNQAAELAQASRYKSEFLANMSHELRTPLNSLLIMARLLADNRAGNLTAEQVRFAETIEGSGNDLLVLINDILDISKIEAGKVDLQLRVVDLAGTLDKLRGVFGVAAADKGLRFEAVIEDGAPRQLETDPQRLEQILRNFLSNAIKFTDSGSVTLEVREGRSAGRVALVVRDSGPGIEPDQHDAIFEAFRQADGSISRRYGGTGLGLSISRELARLLGGEILLDSTPGQGSAFTLELPERIDLATMPEPARPTASRMAQRILPQPAQAHDVPAPVLVPDDRAVLAGDKRLILVVEDDPVFARILRDLVHELGFQCLIAGTADEGTLLARQYLPHAVILDMNLPDHTGLSVLDRIKRDVRTRHIPVHVVSVDDDMQAALASGAVGYLFKPVSRDALIGMLEGLEARMEQRLRRVLVVEDDATQATSIRHLLASRDVETVEAHDAAACLELVATQTFDCMVMDLNLPDMPGLQLLERLSNDEAFSFPPVIVYTGRDLSSEEELALRRYSKSIIVKGVKSPERLLDEVTLFLHQVVADLPSEHQQMLERAMRRDAMLDGRQVLVVEDDVRNIYALTGILEPHGVRLRVARNGREAIEVLDGSRADGGVPVDLVLMDIMMPEMDGLTAMRHLRAQPQWQNLPIIALTAKAMERDQQECLDAGANDYLAKPLDVDKLLSLVRVWMPR
ncbi:histidine kinase [Croceibacterium mercuriale]|uniref:histidine kinase n=1 Tax=Croceibacterium mercuriale TaxID=1572751 RepID=A0A0B2C292_9SPHN|nr:response regulator [Croceibacterium mercuriale]KHL26245.1 histidine kinase [Croceibacterium mercuriale]